MLRFVKLTLIVFALFKIANSSSFWSFPNPAELNGTGAPLMVSGIPSGTYEIWINISTFSQFPVYNFHMINYVINKPDISHCIAVWNLLREDGASAGPGTYRATITLKNKNTGANITMTWTIAVSSNPASYLPATTVTDQYGDKIYWFPAKNRTAKKAIIYFKGWDPLNTGDGWNLCYDRYPLISANDPSAEMNTGWDIFFVKWADAGISLNTNVLHAIQAVNLINSTYGPFPNCVLIGMSMGGILGRYALAKSETDGAPLPITKFISVEGEQQGAHINLSFQGSVVSTANGSSGGVVADIGRFLGLLRPAQTYKNMLYSQGAKEMLYYHVGLVENYLHEVMQNCVFYEDQLDEIRLKASVWHDSFYGNLRKQGRCQGGYPSFCKNYAISLGTKQLEYSPEKTVNQDMGLLSSTAGYIIVSDFQDLDQGSFVSLQDNPNYTALNGYGSYLNFVRLESVFDLQRISYAKSQGKIVKELNETEILQHSRFDKIYVRPNGLRQDHTASWDDITWGFIRDALNDQTPKSGCKTFGDMMPILNLLLND